MTYYDPQQPNQNPAGGQPGGGNQPPSGGGSGYPGQPPQPGYGQQPGGGYQPPPPGGYPPPQPPPQAPQYGQQPPQYGQPQYGQPQQPQYGQPQYGQTPPVGWSGYGAPPPPPPSKNRLPWIIAAVVVLAGLIVGLVVVLGGSDDKKTHQGQSGSPGPTSTNGFPTGTPTNTDSTDGFPTGSPIDTGSGAGPTGDTTGAGGVAQALVSSFNQHDLSELKSLACASTTITVSQADLDDIQSSQIVSGPDVTGDTAVVNVDVTHMDNHTEHLNVKLAQDSGDWCVDSF